jgi:nucleotide-binding universal stress UspA family protein
MLYLRKVKEKILHFKKEVFSKNTKVNYYIKLNTPAKGILKQAEKMNSDLIVMGYKGHSDFEELIIGSNTEKVVRSAKQPVIVIKKDFEKFNLKNIVFASDFTEENKEVFKKFITFANIFKSKIHLLKVNTPANFKKTFDTENLITEFASKFQLKNFNIKIYNDATVEKGILNFSSEINADLVGLSTHGRSGLAHLFAGSIVKKLTKSALKPMLTIKIQ